MDYLETYRQKVISVDEALRLVESGRTVTFSSGVAGPLSILRRFHEVAGWARNVRVLTSSSQEEYPYLVDPAYRDVFETDVVFSSPGDRAAYANGTASYLPAHMNNAAKDWVRIHPVDIFYGTCSPVDEHGYIHIAPSMMLEAPCLAAAKTIVMECSPNIPVVYGSTSIHVSDVDYFVESDMSLIVGRAAPDDPRNDTLGDYIAELIHDGDCLQLGIGGIPNAVARKLFCKHDLGIHTEMLTNSMADLAEAGVINGRKKNFFTGKIVGVFVLGDKHLYDFLDHNTTVEFHPASFVLDPRVIGRNDNMVSVNTCFCCDLTGQVASEAIGTRQYSGTGGQACTAVGASYSRGGRSIIAMRSTAMTKNGLVSNINAVHPAGTVVSLHRADVDYIVTEYGIAPLRGRSIRQRIENLIAVAHPDYREELRRDAERLHLKY